MCYTKSTNNNSTTRYGATKPCVISVVKSVKHEVGKSSCGKRSVMNGRIFIGVKFRTQR